MSGAGGGGLKKCGKLYESVCVGGRERGIRRGGRGAENPTNLLPTSGKGE